MTDQYTEVTHTSYSENVMNSFLIALFGIFLFFASLLVLWFNEGRLIRQQLHEPAYRLLPPQLTQRLKAN